MKVSGIFKTLIVVVCCIVIGATVINVFMPNTITQLSQTVEDALFKATGMAFDFNGDGTAGNSNADNQYTNTEYGGSYADEVEDGGATVEGFQ